MRYGGLILAIVFAAIAAVVVLRFSGNSSAPTAAAPAPEAKNINIYVATKPLPIGTTIAEGDIGVQPWPEHLMLDGFVTADGKTNLVGMVTRATMQQNEPVTSSKVANPNDPNFLAGDLPKGMRVVTIPLTETDGVAGFVFPGDHVDLIYTHDVDRWVYPPNAPVSESGQQIASLTKATVTETLLTNVKVLAIDQRSSGAGAVDAKGNLVIPRSASLMVSATDSQRVRLANKSGTVSLVLRALTDKESADPLIMTSPKDVSQWKDLSTDASSGGNTTQGSIKVVRGVPATGKESIGGDAEATRGVTGATGSVNAPGMGNPVGALPSGGSVVTPGLMAF